MSLQGLHSRFSVDDLRVKDEDIFHEDAFIVDNHDEANKVCICILRCQ